MFQKIKITLLALFFLALGSCVTNKNYIYLQNKTESKDSTSNVSLVATEYKIQKGDIIYIGISTEDEKLNKVFSPGFSTGAGQMLMQNASGIGTPFYLTGFTVSSNGALDLPYLGQISVEGKTTEEVQSFLLIEVKKLFNEVSVIVKMAEFRFSIIGEVRRPGQYFFTQNKVSILEAFSLAGDLTDLADRKALILYRQQGNKVYKYELDITDSRILNSPFWYLQPNDVIYAKPLKVRQVGNLTSAQNTIGFITPLLSTLLIVINTYILVSKL